jgi:hypothetical protein
LKSASGGRSAKIAAALVEGKSLAAVARQEGVSRQAIWKQASAVHLRHIVPALVDAEWERIEALFLRTLQAIEEALHADLKRVAKDGTVVELGPDHYARLTAAKRLLELLTAGRLAQKEPEERKPGCTWEDFKALLREQGTSRLAEQRALRGPVAAGSVCSVRIRLPEPTRCDPASDAERRPGRRCCERRDPRPAGDPGGAGRRDAPGRNRAGGADRPGGGKAGAHCDALRPRSREPSGVARRHTPGTIAPAAPSGRAGRRRCCEPFATREPPEPGEGRRRDAPAAATTLAGRSRRCNPGPPAGQAQSAGATPSVRDRAIGAGAMRPAETVRAAPAGGRWL